MQAKKQANAVFHSTTYGLVTLDKVIDYLRHFLEENPEAKYGLVIGTDSQEKTGLQNGQKMVNLITTIIIHRRGFGGKYFWQSKKAHNIHSLREKIYAETFASLDFATYFVPLFKKSLNGKSPEYDLEIHVDVGEYGDTRDMIKEVVGIVTGNGFVAKTKPEAYGASHVADKHT